MNTANKYIKCMFASGLFFLNAPVAALTQLDDQELRQVSGQSLFSLTYVAPSQNGNPHNNIGFYRVDEADIEINANIRRLALGCDGINGAGRCDIARLQTCVFLVLQLAMTPTGRQPLTEGLSLMR